MKSGGKQRKGWAKTQQKTKAGRRAVKKNTPGRGGGKPGKND